MSLLSKLTQKTRTARENPEKREVLAPKPLTQPKEDALDVTSQGTAALMIACPDPTAEDSARDAHRLRGQFLARQDLWEKLSKELRLADVTSNMTPAAMPVSELLSYGARSDVVMAAEHALLDGKPAPDAPLMNGIEGLEEMLADMDMDPMCAIVVAQAHMDLGWAWRGMGRSARLKTRNREAFEAHFDRASDILDTIEADCSDSSFFQGARCALNGAGINPQHQIARDYELLIDLNPMAPGPMRALGTYLSPRWFGSLQELELQARRTAARTHAQWGAAGYTWVMFDVLVGDDDACANLDTEFFIEGLHDILERMPDQHTSNMLAALCAHMNPRSESRSDSSGKARRDIAACAGWIVRNHMTELHPLIWAHAAAGFANNVNVASPRRFAAMGQRDGLRVIAQLFQGEISQGRRIIFTAEGPVAEAC